MYIGSNPSALRSQQLLAVALIDLMQEHPYTEITVTMLSMRAGVSRQTFYKMFDGKDDVVRYVSRARCLGFELQMIEHEKMTLKELAEYTFAFFDENIILVRQLITNQLHHLLQEQAQRALADLLACFRCDGEQILDPSNCAFIAGGLCAMLVSWAREDGIITPEKHAERFARLFTIQSFTRIESVEQAGKKLLAASR